MRTRSSLEEVARKSYWREADARVAIEAWRSSGLSLREFSRGTGIDKGRIRRWAGSLEDRVEAKTGAIEFHPVRVVERGPEGLEMKLTLSNGRSVAIPEGFDLEYLERLLTVVEKRS